MADDEDDLWAQVKRLSDIISILLYGYGYHRHAIDINQLRKQNDHRMVNDAH